MSHEEAKQKLHSITKGIDQDECESELGWWETSGGAEYGAGRLKELESLIDEIYESR